MPTPSRWVLGGLGEGEGCVYVCPALISTVWDSFPPTHTPRGAWWGSSTCCTHMFLQFKEGADLHEVVNFNTSQSCLRTFQKNLTADSFIKQIWGCFKKQTRWAFFNESSRKPHFLNWCVLSPWVPSWTIFFYNPCLWDMRHVKYTSLMTAR